MAAKRASEPAGRLEVRGLRKHFGREPVLRGVSFDTAPGEIVALLGPSGCGKSTILRIVAGLEPADSGSVIFAERAVDPLPVHQRGFGLMFQDWALFPHRTVAENIGFGLRMQRLERAAVERRVAEMLETVGLAGYGGRTIFELSGGERQRVALARSLAPRPRLLMLDEPLSSLDRTLRERLTGELRETLKAAGVTAIYVTHDQMEAWSVADRLLLMRAGEIVQAGTPEAVYRHPASAFVARFFSLNNLLPCSEWRLAAGQALAETRLGRLVLAADAAPPGGLPAGEAVAVLVRPEAAAPARPGAPNLLRGTVTGASFRGGVTRIGWRAALGAAGDADLQLDWPSGAPVEVGQALELSLQPHGLSLLARDE